MQGLGIDAVEIHRFRHWHTFKRVQLLRIFSSTEIDHCLASAPKSAERFAVRFAAKEAFFKAWNSAFPAATAPFLTFCRAVSVDHNATHTPHLVIRKNILPPLSQELILLLSLTHTQTTAIACVLINIQSETNK